MGNGRASGKIREGYPHRISYRLETSHSHAQARAPECRGITVRKVDADLLEYFRRRPEYGRVRADASLRAGADKHVRLEDDFLAGFNVLPYPAEKVDAFFNSVIDLIIVISSARHQGNFSFGYHFYSLSDNCIYIIPCTRADMQMALIANADWQN